MRRQLAEESPSSEQLRADLADSQSKAGDLLASTGKLADAVKTWEKSLATLEEGVKTSPKSIPFRTACSERLLSIADQFGNIGRWREAAAHFECAFRLSPALDYLAWYKTALVMWWTGDTAGYHALVNDIGRLKAPVSGAEGIHVARLLVLCRKQRSITRVNCAGSSPPPAMIVGRAGSEGSRISASVSLPLPSGCWMNFRTGSPSGRPLRLALHHAGRADGALAALEQADKNAEKHLRAALENASLHVPVMPWQEWIHMELCRREAHQAIHGKPMPLSPYERLFHGRSLWALHEIDRAEAEFAAAVVLHPHDADVWLSRSHVLAKLDLKDRMAADLLRAQELKGDDPRTWVETGRVLAECGEDRQAELAFARAAKAARES